MILTNCSGYIIFRLYEPHRRSLQGEKKLEKHTLTDRSSDQPTVMSSYVDIRGGI